MNKVSYTISLTVGLLTQVDAVVLGCSHETSLFVRMLARKLDTRKSTECVWTVFKKNTVQSVTKKCESGDRSYSTPSSSPKRGGITDQSS